MDAGNESSVLCTHGGSLMRKAFIHFISIGFYIWAAVWAYDKGKEFVSLALQEHEEFELRELTKDRVHLTDTMIAGSTKMNTWAVEAEKEPHPTKFKTEIMENI